MNKISLLIVVSSYLIQVLCTSTCGVDNSKTEIVYEGRATIDTYPWLGILIYHYEKKRVTTAVVLVTRQIALAAAAEIDHLPKYDFRSNTKVVIGGNCSGPHIGVRDYSYHPDYNHLSHSSLAMIQLETDVIEFELRPICPPPMYFKNPKFYAMVLSDDCSNSRIGIYKMKYVSLEACRNYYRRSGLGSDAMWPSHLACARSVTGGRCIWRSGAVLTVKFGNRWSLLGFGIYGPGCEAPARFLDYGMYHKWVSRSLGRIGRAAITTVAKNHIIMRRTSSSIQRFGECDLEEKQKHLYSDYNNVTGSTGFISYNVSLYVNMEYSCLTFKAEYNTNKLNKPQLRLRRWCAGELGMCFGFGYLSIHFYVEVTFERDVNFGIVAYGKMAILMDPARATRHLNRKLSLPIPKYTQAVLSHKAISSGQPLDEKKERIEVVGGKQIMIAV